MTKSLGMICLAIFLVLYGLLALTNLQFIGAAIVLGVLAIVAGILILLGR